MVYIMQHVFFLLLDSVQELLIKVYRNIVSLNYWFNFSFQNDDFIESITFITFLKVVSVLGRTVCLRHLCCLWKILACHSLWSRPVYGIFILSLLSQIQRVVLHFYMTVSTYISQNERIISMTFAFLGAQTGVETLLFLTVHFVRIQMFTSPGEVDQKEY